VICAVLALGALSLYLPSGWHGFIDYDDDTYILDNPHVLSGLNAANILWAFRTSYAGNWHPITWLSHMLDCEIFGPNPGPAHIVNALFHSANSVLLFLTLLCMTRFLWRSALVAAVFAVHPLHVESVAWLAERKDLLSTFFALATLLIYGFYSNAAKSSSESINKKRRLLYCLSLLCYVFGLMSKPMLVTLPFLLLLLDYWPLERIQNRAELKRMILEKLPFIVLAASSSIITFAIQNRAGAVASLQNLSILHRIGNAALTYCLYLAKIFWPRNLMIPYVPEQEQSILSFFVAGGILVFVTFIAIRNSNHLVVGWFWYLGTLIPVIGLVQVGIQSMADRYTYIPSIGIFIMLTWSIADLLRLWRVPTIFGALSSAIVLSILGTLTFHQLAFWKNSETLFLHSAAVDPTNLPVASLLAWTYATDPDLKIRDGQKAVSLAEFCVEQTQRREPWYLDVLAAAYAETGKFSLAVDTANEALLLIGGDSQSEFVADLKGRIELYKAGRAVHRP